MCEILLIFLRIGSCGFGGPLALIALMEEEVCKKRNWFTIEEFTQVYGICKLFPGPVATQVAIYLGYKKCGRSAGFLAGFSMNLPAALMMFIISILYVKYGHASPKFISISNFMQNAALAVIILVTLDLAKVYIKNVTTIIILLLAGGLIFYVPRYEPIIIITFGILGILITYKSQLTNIPIVISIMDNNTWQGIYTLLSNPKLLLLFWVCFSASAFIFGTGLAIIPLLHGELVQHLHWLSSNQSIDGITFGQITPGPVSVSVIFFGYIIAGAWGSVVAIVGFLLPPFINTLIILPLLWNKIIKWQYLQVFSLWAFPAIIGGIAGAAVKIGMSSIINWHGVLVLVITFILVYKKWLPTWLLIPCAGVIGAIITYL